MRAMIPDGHGSVTCAEVAEPASAPGGVVVAVEAYSVNRGETFLLESPPPGWRPGKDVAGTVVAAGAETNLRIGARVVAHPEHSGWAELVAVPPDRVAELPDGIPSTVAAALPLAGLTALRLVRLIGALPGRSILLTGASGGVGHYFVELAAGLGAAQIITEIADARGHYDVVIESISGEVFPAAWRHLHPRGTFVWTGQASRRPPAIDFFD